MPGFTLDDLRVIMRSCGVEESLDFEGDINDIHIANLGYDSLAMLQIASLIERETSITIDDAAFAELDTPRTIIHYVNAQIVNAQIQAG
ncbi:MULTISPECIES: acyl carrier protein [unclassified Nonomuraea]|uniref:acyl carrier protein n=1 Tax=unclassified Nonomuraea TaxID=2593643 RepID=UPI0033C28751